MLNQVKVVDYRLQAAALRKMATESLSEDERQSLLRSVDYYETLAADLERETRART